LPEEERRGHVIALGRSWTDSRLKLLVTHRLLALRRERYELILGGNYVPLETTGALAQHVVALGWRRREHDPLEAIAVVPRHMQALLAARPADDRAGPLWTEGAWAETQVLLPDGSSANWRCLFTERTHSANANALPIADLLGEFPLAVLCTF
jgi:maltooligosyltrehalose synthase